MKPFLTFCWCLLLCSCSMTSSKETKIDGVSFVASRDSIDVGNITSLVKIHANYASIMPFGFIRDISNPDIQYNTHRQWFGETKAGVKQYINVLKREGIRIMLKPQIWVWHGAFTGTIEMASEENWKLFEDSYSRFILDYALLAQQAQVDIFCIGTELERFIDERPAFWNQLITDVRKIYKGKLTYAANWNEYNRTPFWEALDYMGIDAYFPVSHLKTPTLEACKKGLEPWKIQIKTHYDSIKKPVLFTEFGYRSVDFAGKAPWRSDRDMKEVNHDAQTNATQAFLETFWNENWIAGGFVWKWHPHEQGFVATDNSAFTPQNKPAEAVIKAFFSKQ